MEKVVRVDMAALRNGRHLASPEPAPGQDHFIERDGVRFAGTHLIVDLCDAIARTRAEVWI